MENTSLEKTKKRKRTINTCREQYELYLTYLESNYVFRSGTINPTLGDNYLENVWEEMTNQLNAIGNGPQLTKEEWKKRFTDWKHSTRAKFRKIRESRNGTGGGEQIKTKLSDLEERGIAAWGKVAVTGTSSVPESGGLQNLIVINAETLPTHNSQTEICFIDDPSQTARNIYAENISESDENTNNDNVLFVHQSTPVLPKKKIIVSENIRKRQPSKPVRKISGGLSEQFEKFTNENKELNVNLKKLIDTYASIEQKKFELEQQKLKFEIAKYKAENKDFFYEY